jgi:ABC-type sugar transport system ATPase subunit
MAQVHVERLHKAFPDGTVAVERLDLEIRDGELFVMLGPSGCGKTTTLRCIAGLEEETSGTITIGDRVVSGLRPSQRDIAMVFQFYALYPHLSVRDNMAFPLRAAKAPESEVTERVTEAARMLQLEPFLDRKPNKLSGGEQQRVALGRAMVRHPKAFLMDEPLTNLDAELRADMRAEVKHVQQRLNTTMIYVTHDQTEAMALGHRIAILNKGKLEQLGAPMEVYERPATLFAARFIGSPPMNLVEAEVTNGHLTAKGGLKIAAPEGLKRGDHVIAGVRPERFNVSATSTDPEAARGRIVSREMLGDETIFVVETEAGLLNVRMPPTARFDEDQVVSVVHQGAAPPAYDPQTEQVVSEPGNRLARDQAQVSGIPGVPQ